jgi:glutamate synthase domain-containing protein 3
VADRYWNARGGSHTDGGAFLFTVQQNGRGKELVVTDKFGERVTTPLDQVHNNPSTATQNPPRLTWVTSEPKEWVVAGPEGVDGAWRWLFREIQAWSYGEVTWFCDQMVALAGDGGEAWPFAVGLLTRLRDWQYDPGAKRRASVLALVDRTLEGIFRSAPSMTAAAASRRRRIDWARRSELRGPCTGEDTLVLDAAQFPPEGDDSAARLVVQAAELGWRQFVTHNWRGGRFCGCGLGPGSAGIRIDVYGSSGDYVGSGLQGAELHVHGSAQDQVGQILHSGKLVVHGDVGQTFLYGAKGGEAYVQGNAAGRPLINAAGSPRVVINGTCLDYLAESFMAGDPLHGGGFVILNGMRFGAHGQMESQPAPYPGGNLFSLASGGAIYVRDPYQLVAEDQLNGGAIAPLTEADWALIHPYLQENERLLGIRVKALLTVGGTVMPPEKVYRKVVAIHA